MSIQRLTIHSRYVVALLGLLSFGLALFAAINFVVNPFSLSSTRFFYIPQELLSEKANDRLFRLARFTNNPTDVLVLGDSRAKNLAEIYFSKAGIETRNLAYGGGTFAEVIDTYWYATRTHGPRVVIVGLPFNIYSESSRLPRAREAIALLDNPLSYYLNGGILSISLSNLIHIAQGEIEPSYAPPLSRNAFWDHQINVSARRFYRTWRPPTKLLAELRSVAWDAEKRGAQLVFIIPPTHVDLQKQVQKFNLNDAYGTYLETLASLGLTLHFDWVNETTLNASNFGDPFHALPTISEDVARRVAEVLHKLESGEAFPRKGVLKCSVRKGCLSRNDVRT